LPLIAPRDGGNQSENSNQKTGSEEGPKGRRKKSFQGEQPKKTERRKRNFKPAVFLHFHSAADSAALVLTEVGLEPSKIAESIEAYINQQR
jgi:hypothetical protein